MTLGNSRKIQWPQVPLLKTGGASLDAVAGMAASADRNEVSLHLRVWWDGEPRSADWEFRSESASFCFRARGKSPASQKLSVGTYLTGRCETQ